MSEQGAAFIIAAQLERITELEAEVARLMQERDDLKGDYLRRHKDACDRYEEVTQLRAALNGIMPILADIGYFEGFDPESGKADSLGRSILRDRAERVKACYAALAKGGGDGG